MISFFQNRKPKQFNYKPRYSSEKKSEDKRIDFTKQKYADAMYERYERQRFSDIRAKGRRSLMIKAIILVVLLIALIVYFDKIERILRGI